LTGLGQSVAAFLADRNPPHVIRRRPASPQHSNHVPAIGTDITHMHNMASGAAIGETSLRDFRFFTRVAAPPRRGPELRSAVVLPEVFLKAVALARNQEWRSRA
jgi:hypothetical protein